MVIDMSNYLPNTIDLNKVNEMYGNEKNYNILQVTYRNYVENLINSIIDFKSIQKLIDDSGLVFDKINDSSYNIYHRESKLDSDYIFIRNNIHIENLNENERKALIENKIYESFITDTIDKVLKENEDFLSYDNNSNNLVFTKGLIFEFAYDGSKLTDEERKERAVLINQIFEIMSKSMEESPFVNNYIIYDKKEDYFRPAVKDRNSLLSRLKIVKTVNSAEAEQKSNIANEEIVSTIEDALNTKALDIDKEETNDNITFLTDTSSISKLDDTLFNKLNLIKKKREEKLSKKTIIPSVDLSDSIVNNALKKEMDNSINNNDLLDVLVNKDKKEEVKEEKTIDIKPIKKEINNKTYIGDIGNKKFIIRYISSFKNNDKELNMYDYSINNHHRAYYSEISIDKADQGVIETVFGIDNLTDARKHNTSYLGNVKDNYLVKDKEVDNILLYSKLLRRENSNIVIIESEKTDNSKNYYYILNLADNNVSLVNTETDIFSNVNSNEELSKWLTDDVINTNGYIGKLGLNGVIIKGE